MWKCYKCGKEIVSSWCYTHLYEHWQEEKYKDKVESALASLRRGEEAEKI